MRLCIVFYFINWRGDNIGGRGVVCVVLRREEQGE